MGDLRLPPQTSKTHTLALPEPLPRKERTNKAIPGVPNYEIRTRPPVAYSPPYVPI